MHKFVILVCTVIHRQPHLPPYPVVALHLFWSVRSKKCSASDCRIRRHTGWGGGGTGPVGIARAVQREKSRRTESQVPIITCAAVTVCSAMKGTLVVWLGGVTADETVRPYICCARQRHAAHESRWMVTEAVAPLGVRWLGPHLTSFLLSISDPSRTKMAIGAYQVSSAPTPPIFCFRLCARNAAHLSEQRAAGVRPVLPDPSDSSNEVGSWLPPRPEEQVGRAPGGAALRGGVGGKREAAAPIQVPSIYAVLLARLI